VWGWSLSSFGWVVVSGNVWGVSGGCTGLVFDSSME
jgi:hypothetical protein